MDGWTCGCMDAKIHGWMDGWMDRWMDGWMDVNGRMRCMAECMYDDLSIYLQQMIKFKGAYLYKWEFIKMCIQFKVYFLCLVYMVFILSFFL